MRTVARVPMIALAGLILAGCTTGAAREGAGPPGARAPGGPQTPHVTQARHVSQGHAMLRRWVTAWTASPQAAVRPLPTASGLRNQTVREVVFTSAGGNALRLVLSNVYGTSPLRLGRVTVGLAGAGAAVRGSIRPVTFTGRASVTVTPGAQVTSDPVTMAVPALRDLAVSAYLPGKVMAPTIHLVGRQRTWFSSAGDHAAAAGGAAFRPQSLSWFFLTGVQVPAGHATGTVVAFGDSITDGSGSTVDANARWPDDLARRLNAVAGPTLSVADEGISGDRVTSGSSRAPSGVSRFGPDALDVPGARDIIVAMGINDIRLTGTVTTAQQVLSDYRQLIARAHARGLRVFGATLLPFQGASTYTDHAEALRELVNNWIRTSGAFDAVIDFDALVRDPAGPLRLRPAYSTSDHLHPNDAGYRAMASGISLQLLLRG
jgi:lysophospholipase L1-like esterase